MGATDHRRDLIPHSGHRAAISSVLSAGDPGSSRDEGFSVLLSVPTERKNQERARCTLRVRQNHDFSHFAAGLASLKQVLAMPSAPCSIIGFYTFPSRYRNVIRSKDEDYPSLLSAISSRKATGRRTQFGNLGKD